MSEPDDPETSALKSGTPWMMIALGAISVSIIGGAVIAYANGHVWLTGYTADQWAAAGGWISGFGALAAVGAALYQSHIAIENAVQARTDAEDLLTTELDAQRRSEQLRSLGGIWAAVDGIRRPYDEFWRELVDAEMNLPNPYEFAEESERIANNSGVDLKDALIRANIAFEPALLQVVEPNTQNMVTAFYQDFLDVMAAMMDMIAEARKGKDPGYVELNKLDAQLKKLQEHREPFLNIAREHLTKAEPIQNVPNIDKHGNPHGGKASTVTIVDGEDN